MHHQNNQYTPNLLPPSPRALPSTTTDPLLLTPVLTSHLTSGTSSLPTQPQIGPSLVSLSHEHSTAGINTLYSSLQSAPKKRKLSQDGLIHVKQVLSRFGYWVDFCFDCYLQRYFFFRNLNWVPWSTVAAAVARYWIVTRSLTTVTSTPVINAFGSILFNRHLGTFSAIIISKSYRCHITGWTRTKDSILAIRMMRLFVRKRIIFR